MTEQQYRETIATRTDGQLIEALKHVFFLNDAKLSDVIIAEALSRLLSAVKNQSASACSKHPESPKQDNGARAARWTLIGPQSESSLQCSCGVKHRLQYSRDDTGQHLDLLPPSSLTSQEGHAPIRVARLKELLSILFGDGACGNPNTSNPQTQG